MTAYYNEHDPKAAAWLRELIARGHIAPGVVDERSIENITADDLAGFVQCHFFAGIGVWSYALRLAGWPDDRPVWTGSCPCQPFSTAGRGDSNDDERHLWPAWFSLIDACRPPVVFGEQVASSIAVGRAGAGVQHLWERQAALRFLADGLEGRISKCLQDMQERDRAGTSRLALHQYRDAGRSPGGRGESAGREEGKAFRSDGRVGAGEDGRGRVRGDGDSLRHDDQARVEHPVAGSNFGGRGLHEGQHSDGSFWSERRLWELGRAADDRHGDGDLEEAARSFAEAINQTWRGIEEANGWSWLDTLQTDLEGAGYAVGALDSCAAGVGAPHIRQRLYFGAERLADADDASKGVVGDSGVCLAVWEKRNARTGLRSGGCDDRHDRSGPTNGFWRSSDWLRCRDDRWRPVEPGTFPLAHGAAARVGRLRGYGNGLVAPHAATFIAAFEEALNNGDA